MVPRVILFREEHTPRALVEKVDFISTPGVSDDGVHRSGGPIALVTDKALFRFDKTRPGFELQSVHPGHDLAGIKDATGFQFTHDNEVEQTALPDARTLALLRGRVYDEVAETYPDFAAQIRREVERPLSHVS
jgi:glutaconate CoA-transferase subunit B